MYKKLISLLSVVFFLTGCGAKYDFEAEQTVESKNYSNTQLAQSYYQNDHIADDGTDYYYILTKTDDKTGVKTKYQFYYDSNQGKNVPLCSKANCLHDNDSCDAYLTQEEGRGNYIWYQDKKLYRLDQDRSSKVVNLMQMNPDGSDLKSVGMLWKGYNEKVEGSFSTEYWRKFVLHKGYLYYCYQSSMTNDLEIYRKSIRENEERELLGTIPFSSDYKMIWRDSMTNNEDYIYFSYLAEMNNRNQKVLTYRYSVKDGRFESIFEEEASIEWKTIKEGEGKNETVVGTEGEGWTGTMNLISSAVDEENNLYAFDTLSGKVVKYNADTKQSEQIYRCEYGGGTINYQNGLLYLGAQPSSIDNNHIIVIDTNGNEQYGLRTKAMAMYMGMGDKLIYRTSKYESKSWDVGEEITFIYYMYDVSTGETREMFRY